MRPPVRFVFSRTKTTLNRTYKSNKGKERPPYHPPDPLIDNPRATSTPLLEDDMTFVHRPPPTAPSPFSLTTAPASPLLLRSRTTGGTTATATTATTTDTDITNAPEPRLPPELHPFDPPPRLSDDKIEELRRLRLTDPKRYTRGVLARMFGCTTNFVGLVAALPRSRRKPIVAEREEAHQRMREGWGERKSLAKAIKRKRREFW